VDTIAPTQIWSAYDDRDIRKKIDAIIKDVQRTSGLAA
jgi:hypothetical protein